MGIIRSSKLTIRYSTKQKRKALLAILFEYSRLVNRFIDVWWSNPPSSKRKLVACIVNPIAGVTWLSARMIKQAAREALAMIQTVRTNQANAQKKCRKGEKRKCENNS
jgi:predicted transposase